jgi:hypothetical protein
MIHTDEKILKYIDKAIELLDKKYHLPDRGFLAGGSLSNTIWKLTGGEKAIINDIDIFFINKTEDRLSEYSYRKHTERKSTKDLNVVADNDMTDYTDIMYTDNKKNRYICFNKEERNDIFNYITIDSNLDEEKYEYIFKSFDINSCQVGYDLTNKKAYYTPEFKDFLNTRELKVVNIISPSNTTCRLIKKEKDLGNCLLQDFEFLLLKYSYSSVGKKRLFLGKKFAPIFEENKEKIGKYLKLQRVYKNNKEILTLIPKDWTINEGKFLFHYDERTWYSEKKSRFEHFLESNKRYVRKNDLIYFCRNILNDKYKRKLWVEVPQYFNHMDYLNGIDDLEKVNQILWLHCKDIREILGEPNQHNVIINKVNGNSDIPLQRVVIFQDMTLLEQIKVKNYIKKKVAEDSKNSVLINFIQSPLKYETEEDLDFVFQTLRIKYRKEIHERLNMKKENRLPF